MFAVMRSLRDFEEAERQFVERFLRPGMIVLDIGAHHGFYTLLASRKVGKKGKVIAFEPSPRERRRLVRHLRINGCSNVRVEALALAAKEEETTLFVVKGRETGLNSLRPTKADEPLETISVTVTTLDGYLEQKGIAAVDFIKMDVEGTELEVLKGATHLLSRPPRPVILSEVQDIRTESFGYRAKDILEFLHQRNFHWFKIRRDGKLLPLSAPNDLTSWESCNFVAVPIERLKEIESFL